MPVAEERDAEAAKAAERYARLRHGSAPDPFRIVVAP